MLHDMGWESPVPTLPNPYTSLKPLQSGTLANDLYRKNAWLCCYVHSTRSAAQQAQGVLGLKRVAGGFTTAGRAGVAAAKAAARALFTAVLSPWARLFGNGNEVENGSGVEGMA